MDSGMVYGIIKIPETYSFWSRSQVLIRRTNWANLALYKSAK